MSAEWDFDGDTLDNYGTYNATAYNGPTYVTGYTGQSGTALAFDRNASQYVMMSSPFVDLSSKSFTVEMWFYSTIVTAQDYGLFGQCQTIATDLCLILMLRNYHPYLAFHGGKILILTKDVVSSSRKLVLNTPIMSFRRYIWRNEYLYQSVVSRGFRLRLFVIHSIDLLERTA